MINLIKEFFLFYSLRKSLDIRKIDNKLKIFLRGENSEMERELNEVLLYNLSRRIIRGEVPYAFASGFKTALMLRSSLKNK